MTVRNRAKLFVEQMEDRTLPAGTVNASFGFGVLTLTGDALHNDIEVKVTAGTATIKGKTGLL